MLKHGLCRSPRNNVQRLIKTCLGRRGSKSSTYATVAEVKQAELSVGDRIHGFTVLQAKTVPELHLTALKLKHDKTGAEYLHVDRDDKNNVFAINFKTNPTDRTGLPHILEHVTLCGSEKYPVRDPFFKMMPRSLANFMNAFTAADYTSYPFATTNVQDYQNLSSVYLDATLHPLLKQSDFLQEGWRLGPEDPRDVATKDNVIFKGVVYNEMKGQMSDASYLFYIRFREHLFPSLENSGGDPDKMTDLTYESLVNFSRQHYHPSNARLFSYGNLPLTDRLPVVNEALSRFDKSVTYRESRSPIDLRQGLVTYDIEGPLDTMQPLERQTKSSVTWLACDSSDILESFSVSVMMSLLMSGYASPLYSGLIESGVGTSFSPNTGYDGSSQVGTLSIGVDGMRTDDATKLPEILQQVLREKAHEAFLPQKIEGILHQLEIALKHKTAAFGVGLLEKVLPAWFNGVDPMEALSWNSVVDAFKSRIQQQGYLESLVEKYLLNDKYMHFTMKPSESYNTKLEAREEQRRLDKLEKIEAAASSPESAFAGLGQQELNLLHEQESAPHQHLETLPTLHVKDVAREKERKPRHNSNIGDVSCLWREASTNGITYFQAKHLLHDLPDDLRLLLPLFTDCLMRLGTRSRSVGDLESEILLRTGGISISPFSNPDPFSIDNCNEGLLVDGYALDKNVPAMFDLIHMLLKEIDFSSSAATSAIQELLESKTSGALDSVAESGHHFATMSASASLTRRGRIQDQLSGLSQLEATARMLETARADPGSLNGIISKLKQIQSFAVTNSDRLSLRVVCESSSVTANTALLEDFLRKLPKLDIASRQSPAESVPGSLLSRRTFFNLPFQVSYTGTCLQTVPYVSPDKAPLTILGQLLTHNFLHPEVREKGGAYGASAAASPISGLFTMSSYRDPNPRNSLTTFERAGIFARDRAWSSREIDESKLGMFQQLDAPTSVSSDAGKQFMYGITEDMDQQMREQLLDVTQEDVQRVAQRYLVDLPPDQRSVCILGEKKEWIGQDPQPWQEKHLKTSPDIMT